MEPARFLLATSTGLLLGAYACSGTSPSGDTITGTVVPNAGAVAGSTADSAAGMGGTDTAVAQPAVTSTGSAGSPTTPQDSPSAGASGGAPDDAGAPPATADSGSPEPEDGEEPVADAASPEAAMDPEDEEPEDDEQPDDD